LEKELKLPDLSKAGLKFPDLTKGELKLPDFMKDISSDMASPGGQKGMSPLQMVNAIGADCRDVPELIKEGWDASECRGSPSDLFDLFKVMLTAFVHKEMGEMSELPADFKRNYNAEMAKSCNQPKCKAQLEKLMDHSITCELSAICALESKWLTQDICKATIVQLAKKTLDGQAKDMCAVETGTGTFCHEADVELIFEQPDCWSQIFNPINGCTPKCTSVWKDFRRRFPVCSSKIAEQAADMQNIVQGVAQSLMVGQGSQGMSIHRSADEICTDLTFQFAGALPAADDFQDWGDDYGEEGEGSSWGEEPEDEANYQVPAMRPQGRPAYGGGQWQGHQTQAFHV